MNETYKVMRYLTPGVAVHASSSPVVVVGVVRVEVVSVVGVDVGAGVTDVESSGTHWSEAAS